jgi:hypothetical protein
MYRAIESEPTSETDLNVDRFLKSVIDTPTDYSITSAIVASWVAFLNKCSKVIDRASTLLIPQCTT